jgi:hypothetical protein
LLDFGLGATDWDADKFYVELGGRRTYLGGRGGGSGVHGGAHRKGAARCYGSGTGEDKGESDAHHAEKN